MGSLFLSLRHLHKQDIIISLLTRPWVVPILPLFGLLCVVLLRNIARLVVCCHVYLIPTAFKTMDSNKSDDSWSQVVTVSNSVRRPTEETEPSVNIAPSNVTTTTKRPAMAPTEPMVDANTRISGDRRLSALQLYAAPPMDEYSPDNENHGFGTSGVMPEHGSPGAFAVFGLNNRHQISQQTLSSVSGPTEEEEEKDNLDNATVQSKVVAEVVDEDQLLHELLTRRQHDVVQADNVVAVNEDEPDHEEQGNQQRSVAVKRTIIVATTVLLVVIGIAVVVIAVLVSQSSNKQQSEGLSTAKPTNVASSRPNLPRLTGKPAKISSPRPFAATPILTVEPTKIASPNTIVAAPTSNVEPTTSGSSRPIIVATPTLTVKPTKITSPSNPIVATPTLTAKPTAAASRPSFATTALPTNIPSPLPSISSAKPTTAIVSSRPTIAPHQLTARPVSLLEAFRSVLLDHNISSSQNLDQSGTPQNDALNWLVNDDNFLNASASVTSIIDRYVLAVIYYADDGNQWKNPSNFLTFQSICAWHDYVNGTGALCSSTMGVSHGIYTCLSCCPPDLHVTHLIFMSL